MSYWGYHLILNCAKCVPATIRNQTNISEFSKSLVRRIKMVPYGEPQIVMFGSGNKKGYTLVQLIETSNITAHFVEETDDLFLDVFSCLAFEPRDVMDQVKYHFNPMEMDPTFLKRRAPILDQILI
jgi:S-adenosylmethionine/arginine decarboxylase-like enzyme